ncbi:DMT family transporter [Pseudotabrizicola sp. 4114]|uniref:DMT family transporter n=1 Tax=Pseudotabrizicola sp. 4114 TaxID=2817731 RepID=UPI0028583422|nr:drug/metabolite transporter (DMT)-like permease [Pseudorhodobacter sp. 4114]
MTGEFLAVLSAMAYGVAGVAITRGKAEAKGDNGVFLSVIVVFFLTLGLWGIWGKVSLHQLADRDSWRGLGLFALAGFCATVVGRITMYRSIERIGAIKAGLLRRLIPVFAVPCGLVLLGEWPDLKVLMGGAIIMLGVLCYQVLSQRDARNPSLAGDLIGIASALSYALAYSFRRMGLVDIPDPLLGTLLGAMVGLIWFSALAVISARPAHAFHHLLCDRGIWHWTTALSLGIGQTLQFFSLSLAPVSTVALLGALDLFFSAALVALFFKGERFNGGLLGLAGGLALIGSVILFS